MAALVQTVVADRVVLSERIGTLNISAEGSAPEWPLQVLRRLLDGNADDNDREALEKAIVAGGSSGRLAFPTATVIVNAAENVHQTTQVVEAGALAAALAMHQKRIDGDQVKSSLQAYAKALRAWTGTLPYRLAHQPRLSLDALCVPLSGRESRPDGPVGALASLVGGSIVENPGRPVLILGEAGSGKSTFLRNVAHFAWDEPSQVGLMRPHLVMPIRLRAFPQEGTSVEERLWQALSRSGDLAMLGSPPPGYLLAWAKTVEARWLILLDGLDEVARERRGDIVEWMLQLSEQSDLFTLILTSRSEAAVDDSKLSAIAFKVSLEPLSKAQKAEVGRRWLGADPEPFMREIERAGLATETATPLVTSLAASVFGSQGKLPESRAEIFDRFVSLCLRQAERQGVPAAYDIGEIVARQALQHLALAMTEDRTVVDEARVQELLCDFLSRLDPGASPLERQSRANAFSSALALTGLLKIGPTTRWLHASVREYFAAQKIARECPPDSSNAHAFVEKWQDDIWRGAILFLFYFWAEMEERDGSATLPLTSACLRRIVFADAVRSTEKPFVWGKLRTLIAKTRPSETQEIRSKAALLFAVEVVAEVNTLDQGIVARLIDELSGSRRLLQLKGCVRLFKEGRDELDALVRWRGRPQLLRLMEPLISKLEQLAADGDESEASGALAFLGWIGREDRLRALAARVDIAPAAVFGALRRLAGEDQDKLVDELFTRQFEAQLEKARTRDQQVRVVIGLQSAQDFVSCKDHSEAIARVLDTRLPTLQRMGAALDFIRTGGEVKELPPEGVQFVANASGGKGLHRVVAELRTGKALNLLDSTMAAFNDAELDRFVADTRLPSSVRDYIQHFRKAAPARPTAREMLDAFAALHLQLEGFTKSLSDAVSTLKGIGRADLIRRYAQDPRLDDEWAMHFIKGIDEPLRQELARQPELPLRRCHLVWRSLTSSANEEIATAAKEAYRTTLDRLLEVHPEQADEWRRRRADFQFDERRYAEAITEYDWLIERHADDAELYYLRAYAKFLNDDEEEAVKDCDRALSHNSRHAGALYVKGQALRYLGRYRDGIDALSLAIRAGNDSRHVFEARARMFYRLGFCKAALADWHMAYGPIEVVSDLEQRAGYASAMVGAGRYEDAIGTLKGVLVEEPDRGPELDDLARCLVVAGKLDEARDVIWRAHRTDPTVTMYCLMLGLVARLSGVDPATIAAVKETAQHIEDDALAPVTRVHLALILDDRTGLDQAAGDGNLDWAGVEERLLRWALWELQFAIAHLGDGELAQRAANFCQPILKHLESTPIPGQPTMADAPAPEIRAKLAKPAPSPNRLPRGTLCKLAFIDRFRSEMEFSKAVLAHYQDKPTLFVFTLEDDDHIYGQCGFKLDSADAYETKFVAPFQYVARGLFTGDTWIQPMKVGRILFDNRLAMQRFSAAPSLAKHKAKFEVRDVSG